MDQKGEFSRTRLAEMITPAVNFFKDENEVIIVSSGAVGLGAKAVKLPRGTLDLPHRQACAAIGQSLLMDQYRLLIEPHAVPIAQVLLSASDFSSRVHYLNIRETIETLLEMRVIPIINENDTVSTEELTGEPVSRSFGDNDKLSALIASETGADLLILLTDVDGIYNQAPGGEHQAALIPEIKDLSSLIHSLASNATNAQSNPKKGGYGRGGISAKLEAARIASLSGVPTLVISGHKPDQIEKALTCKSANENPGGSWVQPRKGISRKKRWIGFSSGFKGVLTINEGARRALLDRQASLLPVGLVRVEGTFAINETVSIRDESGKELGRGLTSFSSGDLARVLGKKGVDAKSILGPDCADQVIHRDLMILFES